MALSHTHPHEEDLEGRSSKSPNRSQEFEKQQEKDEHEITPRQSSDAEELDVDPNIVDFDGPTDPNNPYNWSKGKKWMNAGLLSLLNFVTPLASSMFAPAVPKVLADFNTRNATLGSMVVSIYVLGYAFGPLFIAPLSEIYGRSITYHVTNVLLLVFTVACAVSTNTGMLTAFRFLAGMMGSTPLTIGGGTVGDMFRTEERGAVMAISSLGPLLGPVVGPIAGSYLSEAAGWRWDFWLIVILTGVITVGMMVFLRESYAPVILERKAKRLRKETGNQNLRSKLDTGLTSRDLLIRSLSRPMKMLVFSPIVFVLSLYMAIVYGYLYLLFTTMTKVFRDNYDFTSSSVGLAFLGLGIGMFIGLMITGATLDRTLKKLAARNNGQTKPEFRLPLTIPAAMMIPIGLFMYGWTAHFRVHYIVPIIGTGFVGLGLITTFLPIMTYLVDAFNIYAASAIAANTVFRSLLGALLPLAGPSMYDALGLGWGNSLLGFIALAMLPFPFIIWKYGERIRTSKRFNVTF